MVEMSEKWNITSRRIGVLCAEWRVEGILRRVKSADGCYKSNK